MGFLTDEERESLRIAKMILHVVGKKAFTVEKERKVVHEPFFVARIRDTDLDPVHGFDPASTTKAQLEQIASRKIRFQRGSQAISKRFSGRHRGSARDGAFFIFELIVEDPLVRIYSLIKYDYREAIEQTAGHGGLLRRILHAFIADKKAIQKSAFVRVVGASANGPWVADAAVAARDRMKQAPDITDYFAEFLGVVRTRSNRQLTQQMVEVLRTTLAESQAVLPDGDAARALRRAKAMLQARHEISSAVISEAVLSAADDPADAAISAALQSRLTRKIRTAKLDGLEFRPDPEELQRPPMRQLRTTEGITLLYPDDAEGTTVRRVPREDGGEVITIRTQQVTEDRIVRESARRID